MGTTIGVGIGIPLSMPRRDDPGPDGEDGLLIDSSGSWFLLIDSAGHYLTID